jgi:hypothetical protein
MSAASGDSYGEWSVTPDDVAFLVTRNPRLDAWEIMRWLEMNGYDVWTVCSKRRHMTVHGGASPEAVIADWIQRVWSGGGEV